ncbi:kinetochore complex Sim4 subunit Fta1-domain-containing protein [Aspergillus egyptiacus]|nr:kinetochore complex Sim4 subunit Fta1-domain-containing protein [Aspergillus egyptiacus]
MAHPHHLLNTSWTSYRLSPLHHTDHESLLTNPAALETYAARLQDHLTNSLADTQWRDQDSTLSAMGPLKSCTWETITTLSFLRPQQEQEDETQTRNPSGIMVALSYETTTYKAALLAGNTQTQTQKQKQTGTLQRRRGRSNANSNSNSTYLPLLLTRLPKVLRESFTSFLSSTFDTYVSPLRLPSSFLCEALETYVRGLVPEPGSGSSGAATAANRTGLIEDVVREMHLTLSFSEPVAPLLKALNLSIPRETFKSFLSGASSSSALPGERKKEEEEEAGIGDSVLSGLEGYLRRHLALELGLDILPLASEQGSGSRLSSALAGGYVRLTRVACAGFVVTGEGRIKVVASTSGVDDESDNPEKEDERNRGALRGGEALVRAVLERAVTGE